MIFMISVEIDYSLAKRLLDTPDDWNYKDKDILLDAIQVAVAQAADEYKETCDE